VNSIGFQNVNSIPLTGMMHIDLANIFVRSPNGTLKLLTRDNPSLLGGITTNGNNIQVNY